MMNAMELGWFSYDGFDRKDYEDLQNYDHRGLNWIVPNKVMTFPDPITDTDEHESGSRAVCRKAPEPCVYFTTEDPTSRESETELSRFREERYIAIKFPDTHKDMQVP